TSASRAREVLRSATTTPRAPAAAKARAVASPIPLAPPVTTQTLSLISICLRPDVLSSLIETLVARLLDRKARDHIQHRRRQAPGARECSRCAPRRVDLHGAAEFVILQDRWLVLRRGACARHALDGGDAALADRVGLVQQPRNDLAQRRLVAHRARGLAGQKTQDRQGNFGQKLLPDPCPDLPDRRPLERRAREGATAR